MECGHAVLQAGVRVRFWLSLTSALCQMRLFSPSRPSFGVTRMLRNWVWLLIGLSATAAGIAGIVLPLVPTTPFLLLAAYCFARSSPMLHNWLVTHPTLGRPIDDWQRHRAIGRRTKVISIAIMVVAYVGSVAAGFPPWILAMQAVFLVGAAAFILSRADRPEDTT